ncbi:hypothetical protein H0H92_007105 [Tricholoma furcatifolium]|nr:hypothetical protein H0H92_007105 [Tricholoma furcatifolium]
MADRKMEESLLQFTSITGASTDREGGIVGPFSTREARKYLDKYRRADVAIDAYFNNPNEFSGPTRQQTAPTAPPSNTKLTTLFNNYKDTDDDEISAEGTIAFCQDLDVDPEDVVLLAVAFELKSPRLGHWSLKGWVDGWKALGADSIPAMQAILPQLSNKLASDSDYFKKVYNFTFQFSKPENQRSLGTENAVAFWSLLLPHGMKGGALSHIKAESGDGDVSMEDEEGWKPEYIQWWFDFLAEKSIKGVSKDTWTMLVAFLRTSDSKFSNHSAEDDFVEYAKTRLSK